MEKRAYLCTLMGEELFPPSPNVVVVATSIVEARTCAQLYFCNGKLNDIDVTLVAVITPGGYNTVTF